MINKKPFILFCLSAITSLFLVSCAPTHTFRNMTYLADTTTESEKIVQAYPTMTIERGDRLGIRVSALNMQSAQFYNGGNDVDPAALTAGSPNIGMTASAPVTYLVNDQGDIQFPQIGNLNVLHQTTRQIEDTLRTRLEQYLKEPAVTVQIVNFKINVLGEVNRPGPISVPDGKITVIDAISQAGDLTIDGFRDSIIVVREKDGIRTYGSFDLSSKTLYTSPYYYLKQGDLVYVRMNRNKLLGSDQKSNMRFRNLALVFAALSTAALLIEVLR
jgi:polysaccharide export outer membrane protein